LKEANVKKIVLQLSWVDRGKASEGKGCSCAGVHS